MNNKKNMQWEEKLSKAFGLNESKWVNHANPWSVYTRFFIPVLLVLAIWSRVWLGIFCLIPIGVVIVWNFVNPLIFPHPKSTKNWASKCTFGERIWIKRKEYAIPKRHTKFPNWLMVFSAFSLPFLVYGLYHLDIWTTVAGLLIMASGKAWFLDRMVWLYEDMKKGSEEFAKWEYSQQT